MRVCLNHFSHCFLRQSIRPSSLEAIASWNGLYFMGTKDQLLDRIIDHVSRGKCILLLACGRSSRSMFSYQR